MPDFLMTMFNALSFQLPYNKEEVSKISHGIRENDEIKVRTVQIDTTKQHLFMSAVSLKIEFHGRYFLSSRHYQTIEEESF